MLPNLFFRDIFAHINGGIAAAGIGIGNHNIGERDQAQRCRGSREIRFSTPLLGIHHSVISLRHTGLVHRHGFQCHGQFRGGNRLLGHAGEFNNGDVRSGA